MYPPARFGMPGIYPNLPEKANFYDYEKDLLYNELTKEYDLPDLLSMTLTDIYNSREKKKNAKQNFWSKVLYPFKNFIEIYTISLAFGGQPGKVQNLVGKVMGHKPYLYTIANAFAPPSNEGVAMGYSVSLFSDAHPFEVAIIFGSVRAGRLLYSSITKKPIANLLATPTSPELLVPGIIYAYRPKKKEIQEEN